MEPRVSPRISASLLLALLALFALDVLVDASVHDYAKEKLSQRNAFVLNGGSEGLYASSLTPVEHSIASLRNGDSFIRQRSPPRPVKKMTRSTFKLLFLRLKIERLLAGQLWWSESNCCTPDLAKLGACTQGRWPQVLTVTFKEMILLLHYYLKTVHITRTGMYNLYFIYCDPSLSGLRISAWKDVSTLEVLWRISLAFVVLGIFWFLQYARFWREVLQLQNSITLVIALACLRQLCGTLSERSHVLSCLLFLWVLVCFRPTLGGLTSKVIMLGATFFLASEVLELVENAGTINDLSGKAILFLVLLWRFWMHFSFFGFSPLSPKPWKNYRLTAKLEMYRKFTNALCIYFKSTDVYNERWQNAWVIPAFWHGLSFSLLCIICALWAPSQNSTRYAYSDDGSEELDQEDTISLIKPAPLRSKDNWNLSSPDGKTALTIDPTPVEEGKRSSGHTSLE
ncbi:unnamed protein product [Spirodela intermedia]|uniref:GOST seven transmembrane domain-containing protein n=1 Tax=Spirodela intermedia TaxID=51605 RepID=A0A7I8J333_SPIIN|nr:unnamed protein product [Spirodela intermedia]CAA6664213.1 unnamed protein product [Spirodela intermedia]